MSRVPGRAAVWLTAVLAGVAAGVGATSLQEITPLEAPGEQQIEVLDTGDRSQEVQPLDADALQAVGEAEPRGGAGRTASAVAKVAMTVVAVAVSVGITVVSLLFI